MNKPKKGDVFTLKDKIASLGEETVSDFWKVVRVYDHYEFDKPGGDWGSDGECAWAQKDHDAEQGQKGEWYVIAGPCERAGDWIADDPSVCSFGSYEIGEFINGRV